MPFGLARYKNNKYFKTESGAFGGRVRLLSKKDSIPYGPLVYKFPNKLNKKVQMINELRITTNTTHKIMEDYSLNQESRTKINTKINKNSINFNNTELRINSSDDKNKFLKLNYTEFKPITTRHFNKYQPIIPSETLIRTHKSRTESLCLDLSNSKTKIFEKDKPILSINSGNSLSIDEENLDLIKCDIKLIDKFINLTPTDRWYAGQGSSDIFIQNGSTTENTRELGIGPFGIEEMLWVCRNNDTANDGDGGWDTNLFPIDHMKDYISVVFFKYKTTGTGRFYHGCQANTVTAVGFGDEASGNYNDNPYYNMPLFNLFTADKWYVSIGFLNASHRRLDFFYDKGGIYDLETGSLVRKAIGYKLNVGVTTNRQRVYKYYDTIANTEMCFASPIFTEYDGTENTLTIPDILSRDFNKVYKKLSLDSSKNLIEHIGLSNFDCLQDEMFVKSGNSIYINKLTKETFINNTIEDKSLSFKLLKPFPNSIDKTLKFPIRNILGETVIRLSFNRFEQIRVNKKALHASKRTTNQRPYNDNLFRITKKYSGENRLLRRGIMVEPFRNENINKDIFTKQFNITRRTEQNVRIVRKGILASLDNVHYYEKGELLGVEYEHFDLPVYNENKFEQEDLQITVQHTPPALAMTFEFVSPVISATSEAETVPASSSDALNRIVIEAQKQNYIRFNVQLNNTTINNVTNLPVGFSFDKFGIFGSSAVAGTFTGEIQLVNGNSFPYLLKIHNIKRLQ